MIRLAAVADLHIGKPGSGSVSGRFTSVNEAADVLLLPGDLTEHGSPDELRPLLHELAQVSIPVVAVLGNHDYVDWEHDQLSPLLKGAGVHLLDGDTFAADVKGRRLGIVGVMGYSGGFGGPEDVHHDLAEDIPATTLEAEVRKLERELSRLDTDHRVVMLHYAPIRATVEGEEPTRIPIFGNSRLCEPIDRLGADLVVHGHSHHGTHHATTPGGIPVYNVAAPVIKRPYVVLEVRP